MPDREPLFLIDSACEAFETALRAGSRPDIADQLPAWQEPERSLLFESLFEIELEYRRRDGVEPELREYLERFPDFREYLERRFESPATAGAESSELGQGRLFGDYLIRCEVGRGGMGVVYEAQHRRLDRIVALKILSSAAACSSVARGRFEQEVRAVARLNHPHIVPIYEVGTVDGLAYFTMPLISGRSPTAALREYRSARRGSSSAPTSNRARGDDSARIAASYAAQAGRALAYAHAHGVIHRDVKPSNLRVDDEGKVWVLDFGLARLDDGGMTESHELLGTLRYLAPERLSGKADERGDVYSLGLTLFELVTGRPAFPERDRVKLVHDILHRMPPPLRSVVESAPRDLETIVSRATARNPDDRYPSIDTFVADLDLFGQGLPILSRPVSAPERTLRWVSRNPFPTALIGFVTIIALAALFAARSFRQQASRLSRAESIERDLRESAQASAERVRRSLYRSQMQGASFESGRAGGGVALGSLLEPWIVDSDSGADDLRGFEWYVMRAMLAESTATWSLPHIQGVTVEWNPLDSRLLGAGKAGATVWDRASGQVTLRSRFGSHVRAHWSPDGRHFASMGSDEMLHVMSAAAESGKPLATLETGPGDYRFAWHRDGRRIALQIGRRVVIWDWQSKSQPEVRSTDAGPGISVNHRRDLLAHRVGHERMLIRDFDSGRILHQIDGYPFLESFELSPDGRRLAAGTYSDETYVFDLDDEDAVLTLPRNSKRLCWRDDGEVLATSGDATIQVWDARSGRLLRNLVGHEAWVAGLDFDGASGQLASTSMDTSLRLWSFDAPAGHVVRPGAARRFDGYPTALSWQPDRLSSLLSVGTSGWRSTFDLSQVPSRLLSEGPGGALHWSPDGRHAIEMNREGGSVRDAEGRELFATPPSGTMPDWSPRGDRLYLHVDPSILSIRLPDGARTPVGEPERRYREFDVDPAGQRIAACDEDDGVTVIDLDSNAMVFRTERITPEAQTYRPRPKWGPRGSRIAVMAGRELIILSALDGSSLARFGDHPLRILDFAWSPDGRRIATACEDDTVRLFDPSEGITATFGCADRPAQLTWSPDGRQLVALLRDGRLEIWNATAGLKE